MTRPGAVDWRERLAAIAERAREHAREEDPLPLPPDDAPPPPASHHETSKEREP